MSLQEFQRATAEFIASPERCVRAGADFDTEVAGFTLTDRERRRLQAMLNDRGMSANCMLYRVNRLAPILEVLPRTWRLLGAAAEQEVHAFWRRYPDAVLQYGEEAKRFGTWIEEQVASGELPAGPVLEVLRLELAAFSRQQSAGT
jgi:hypothetical protein